MKDKVRIPSLKDRRRYETQKNQREARKQGTFHPRGLARSVARNFARTHGEKESDGASEFRYPGVINFLPGKKKLTRRIIRKVDSSGSTSGEIAKR